MNRKAFEMVFAVGVTVAALTGSANAQNPPARGPIDASLLAAVEQKDVPGVVALVTNRERVLFQGAFGVADVSTGRPLATDALFRIASMTKPVTSVALMQLVEQGKIGLDDPAEKYLPELKNPMDPSAGTTGNTCFVLTEYYESGAGVTDHLQQTSSGFQEFAAMNAWLGKCKVTAVPTGSVFNSLW